MEPREEQRPAARRPIALWWIGEAPFDGGLLEPVRARVAEEYDCVVTLQDAPARPVDTWDARRHQHASREVLRWLVAQLDAVDGRLMGITDVDLFMPVLTFVFGEAQLEGRAAVISSARLVDPDDRAVTTARLAREAVHELGHTFGLLHCDGVDGAGRRAKPCVMSRSASVRSVDAKSPSLCAQCRARYQLFEQDGSHVYREHENPHR